MKYVTIIAPLLIGGVLGALLGYYGKCTSGACPLTATPWRGTFVGLAMGGLIALSIGCEKKSATADGPHFALRVNGTQQFEAEVLNSDKLALVDFYADWCPPCRQIAPVVEELARNHEKSMVVAKVNVDENRDIAQRYSVSSIPHLVLLKNGEVVDTQTGFAGKAELKQWVDEHLKQSLADTQ